MARRIQRQRTKGWRMPESAVYVGRPTPFGNPFAVGGYLRMEAYQPGEVRTAETAGCRINFPGDAVAAFEWWVRVKNLAPVIRADLAGRDLACWCPLDQPCHADVLLKIANDGPLSRPGAHACATCPDCIHAGNKCCGCYDGACCKEAPHE